MWFVIHLCPLVIGIVQTNSSPTVSEYRKYLNKLSQDFSIDLTDPSKDYSGIKILTDFNKMTNYIVSNDFQNNNKCSNGRLYDNWVAGDSENCKKPYLYIDAKSPNNNYGGNTCLVFNDWSYDTLSTTRYNSCSSGFSSAINSYFSNIKTYQNNIKTSVENDFISDLIR